MLMSSFQDPKHFDTWHFIRKNTKKRGTEARAEVSDCVAHPCLICTCLALVYNLVAAPCFHCMPLFLI